jgi:predicted nucleic acid-binding protein
MTVVVDASVVVAALASADATGRWAESVLAGEPLAAPHLMPAEAASILHRAELGGEISADTASLAHADLGRLRVEYFPYDPFAERIWELRSHPAETLDCSYEQQVEMLQQESDRLDNQARTALAQGREDLAIAALQQKAGLRGRLNDLQGQHASVQRVRTDAADCDTAAKHEEAGRRTGHPGLTSYEAWYVALAEFLGAKLATLDPRLALVPGPRCGFCLPPPPPA